MLLPFRKSHPAREINSFTSRQCILTFFLLFSSFLPPSLSLPVYPLSLQPLLFPLLCLPLSHMSLSLHYPSISFPSSPFSLLSIPNSLHSLFSLPPSLPLPSLPFSAPSVHVKTKSSSVFNFDAGDCKLRGFRHWTIRDDCPPWGNICSKYV